MIEENAMFAAQLLITLLLLAALPLLSEQKRATIIEDAEKLMQ